MCSKYFHLLEEPFYVVQKRCLTLFPRVKDRSYTERSVPSILFCAFRTLPLTYISVTLLTINRNTKYSSAELASILLGELRRPKEHKLDKPSSLFVSS